MERELKKSGSCETCGVDISEDEKFGNRCIYCFTEEDWKAYWKNPDNIKTYLFRKWGKHGFKKVMLKRELEKRLKVVEFLGSAPNDLLNLSDEEFRKWLEREVKSE